MYRKLEKRHQNDEAGKDCAMWTLKPTNQFG